MERSCGGEKIGFLKFHLMTQFNKNKEDIKILWRRRYVEIHGKKVDSYDAETETWCYHKSAKTVEGKVEQSMKAWLAKREHAEPTSESD